MRKYSFAYGILNAGKVTLTYGFDSLFGKDKSIQDIVNQGMLGSLDELGLAYFASSGLIFLLESCFQRLGNGYKVAISSLVPLSLALDELYPFLPLRNASVSNEINVSDIGSLILGWGGALVIYGLSKNKYVRGLGIKAKESVKRFISYHYIEPLKKHFIKPIREKAAQAYGIELLLDDS